LKVIEGFRQTEIAKANKEYGTLYFRFSIQCQSSCKLFLVSQVIFIIKIIFDQKTLFARIYILVMPIPIGKLFPVGVLTNNPNIKLSLNTRMLEFKSLFYFHEKLFLLVIQFHIRMKLHLVGFFHRMI